jgi:hypothetical protein
VSGARSVSVGYPVLQGSPYPTPASFMRQTPPSVTRRTAPRSRSAKVDRLGHGIVRARLTSTSLEPFDRAASASKAAPWRNVRPRVASQVRRSALGAVLGAVGGLDEVKLKTASHRLTAAAHLEPAISMAATWV